MPQPIVKTLEDINNDSLTKVFGQYFNQAQDVKATIDGDFGGFGGTNDNYNSEIKRLTVIVKRNEDQVLFYNLGLPMLAKNCKGLDVIAPKCYYGYSNYEDSYSNPRGVEKFCCSLVALPLRKVEDGLLMLENVTQCKPNPFTMIDKNQVLDVEHVKAAVTALGHFHGSWWRARNDPDFNHEGGMTKADINLAFVEKLPVFLLRKMVMSTFDSVAKLMKNRGESPEMIRRLSNYAKNRAMNRVRLMLCDASKDKSKLVTICHGDFWSNNMMFSHSSDHKPSGVKLIDFQMLAVSHPARDLCYFLYVNTDKAFRDANLNEVLQTYWETFNVYLTPNLDFTFDQFKEEFEFRRDIGFVSGLLVLPNVLSPNQRQLNTMSDFSDLNRHRKDDIASPDKDDDHPMIKEIRRRVMDIVHEFAEIGVM